MPGRISLKPAHFKRLRLKRVGEPASTSLAVAKKPKKTRPMIGQGPAITLDDPALLLRVRLPVRLTNGNSGRTQHFGATARFRKQIGLKLLEWGLRRTPFDHPVTVHLIRVVAYRDHAWDSDSWQRGNWKEIGDALTAVKKDKLPSACWFHDDSKKWIKATTFADETTERPIEPALIIEVRRSS